jgi:hypothetical protein
MKTKKTLQMLNLKKLSKNGTEEIRSFFLFFWVIIMVWGIYILGNIVKCQTT